MKKKSNARALVAFLVAALLVTFSAEARAADAKPQIDTRSKRKFTASTESAWDWVAQKCADPTTDVCAASAVIQASEQCGASAKFLTKDAKAWKIAGFELVIASAAFTGVGASATISNAKIFSTLGGTTGLGAVTTNINSNVSGDQTGLTAINGVLVDLIKYVTTGGAGGAKADNALVYKTAASYANECSALALGSSTSSK